MFRGRRHRERRLFQAFWEQDDRDLEAFRQALRERTDRMTERGVRNWALLEHGVHLGARTKAGWEQLLHNVACDLRVDPD